MDDETIEAVPKESPRDTLRDVMHDANDALTLDELNASVNALHWWVLGLSLAVFVLLASGHDHD